MSPMDGGHKEVVYEILMEEDGKDEKKPGSDLLSRSGLQYHRREGVSLPCSGWERVSPPCYGHQEITMHLVRVIRFGNRNDNMAKPLGSLVPVG